MRRVSWNIVSSFHFGLRALNAVAMRLCSRAQMVCITASWGCSVTRGSPNEPNSNDLTSVLKKLLLSITWKETSVVGALGQNGQKVPIFNSIIGHFQLTFSKGSDWTSGDAVGTINVGTVEPMRIWIQLVSVAKTTIKTRTSDRAN